MIITDAMLFKTNGNNEKVRITSGGNVGIGITNPTVKLVSAGHIKIQGEPTNVSNLIFTRSERSWSINNETDFRIYTSSGTTDSPSSLVLAINGGGNLGIGINSPTRRLLPPRKFLKWYFISIYKYHHWICCLRWCSNWNPG